MNARIRENAEVDHPPDDARDGGRGRRHGAVRREVRRRGARRRHGPAAGAVGRGTASIRSNCAAARMCGAPAISGCSRSSPRALGQRRAPRRGGDRRCRARFVAAEEAALAKSAALLKTRPDELPIRIRALLDERRAQADEPRSAPPPRHGRHRRGQRARKRGRGDRRREVRRPQPHRHLRQGSARAHRRAQDPPRFRRRLWSPIPAAAPPSPPASPTTSPTASPPSRSCAPPPKPSAARGAAAARHGAGRRHRSRQGPRSHRRCPRAARRHDQPLRDKPRCPPTGSPMSS